MKTVIAAINSKYIHSSLAPWYLLSGVRSYSRQNVDAVVREFTINQPMDAILDALVTEAADVYAFCTYIWNIETLKELLPLLKTFLPHCQVILGGPEATFSAKLLLDSLPITYVLMGEGEESFPKLLDAMALQASVDDIAGVVYKKGDEIIFNPSKPLICLPPDPYSPEYFENLNGRIAYIEGSRGCPFSCAFCLSGREDVLRLFPLERVKNDILRLAISGTKTIKFVDRTFNCHLVRCREIISFILSEYGKRIPSDICFHFEVAADLFDEETLALLATAPKGYIQMEAGLQSFHAQTLQAVTRKTNLDTLCNNVQRILENGNIHLHIDLIAGLPRETLQIFRYSFNTAYALKPHMLQLGFLKLLHGSALRTQTEENGYRFHKLAPYEVYASNWMSTADFQLLHEVEDVLERLYNSGRFVFTLQYVLQVTAITPFDLFAGFAAFLKENAVRTVCISLDAYTDYVLQYFAKLPQVDTAVLRDALACDSLCSKQLNRLPSCVFKKDVRVAKIIRRLNADSTVKSIKRGVYILQSRKNTALVVEYTNRDKVTSRYPLQLIPVDNYIEKRPSQS